MFRIISYSKSTDDNSYYIVLDNDGSEVIVMTRSYKVKPMHQKNYIKKVVNIEGKCDYQEVYNFLVDNYPLFIYYVPSEYLSDSMIDNAISKEGDVLSILDKSRRTLNRCRIAVNENGLVYRSVPKEYRSYDLAYSAIKSNPLALKHIEDDFKSITLCLDAVLGDLRAIKYVPEVFKEKLLIQLYENGLLESKDVIGELLFLK